ncbi:MAG: hypothetical protein WCA35_27370 [Kovacikia sp.]
MLSPYSNCDRGCFNSFHGTNPAVAGNRPSNPAAALRSLLLRVSHKQI